MAAYPTGEDVKAWMRSEQFAGAADDDTALDDVAAAATKMIVDRCSPARLPADPDDCPVNIRLAIIMRAASLYVRRDASSGMISFGPDAVMRVNRFDSDVDNLIAPHLAALIG